MTDAEAREPRRARRVTYGLVAVLLVAALVQVELWPVTAFRLFSMVRTGTGSTLQLIATGQDGARTRVPARPQMLARLPRASEATATAMVDSWLLEAGIDPTATETVTLERYSWQLDPQTLEAEETRRVVVREVQP